MIEDRREIAGTDYSYDVRQEEALRDIADRVRSMREGGRLTPAVLGRIRRYFRLKNIYHSNAIEGNILNVGETRQVVEMGLTITGRPLKDQAEARNLDHALDYLEKLAADQRKPLLESDIRQVHQLVLEGIDDSAGSYRSILVKISGSGFDPPGPEQVPAEMAELGAWLAGASAPGQRFAEMQGLVYAAVAHAWPVYIHPFVDGNGRVARLLMNLLLMRYGYPIAIITKEDRRRYYDALEQSQSSDLSPFLGLVTECIHESLDEWERAAEEQREQEEWTQSIANRLTAEERPRAENEYEVWKSAVELLRGYFRQTAAAIDAAEPLLRVYLRDFGHLELEKYLSLRSRDSAKRTWFLRLDFVTGSRSARYLFFFGWPSYTLSNEGCDVTIHVAREEQPYYFEKLENIMSSDAPRLLEIGYKAQEERFIARYRGDTTMPGKVEELGRQFIEEVVRVF